LGGQGGHGSDDVKAPQGGTKAGFHGPDPQQNVGGDAIGLFDRSEQGKKLSALSLADRDAILRNDPFDIVAERLGEFRLSGVQAGDPLIRLKTAKLAIQEIGRQAHLNGPHVKSAGPGVKVGIARGGHLTNRLWLRRGRLSGKWRDLGRQIR